MTEKRSGPTRCVIFVRTKMDLLAIFVYDFIVTTVVPSQLARVVAPFGCLRT